MCGRDQGRPGLHRDCMPGLRRHHGTGYLDASGAAKQGFCVCSKGIWSCGTTAEWPCYPQTAGATVPASCN